MVAIHHVKLHQFISWLLAMTLSLSPLRISADATQPIAKHLRAIEREHGVAARQRVSTWQALIDLGRNLSETEKLDRVNAFFNELRFVDDLTHWGRPDYWATPMETLVTNGGDCEDFSIAKYVTLREMGVPEDRLRLTYVKALRLNQAHMVVTYYPTPDADPLVLDNLVAEIRPASRRSDLFPVYSFNGDGLWLAKIRDSGARVGTSERISLWQDMLERMRKELHQ